MFTSYFTYMSGTYFVPHSNTKPWTDVFQNKVQIQIF